METIDEQDRVATTILDLLAARDPSASVCPSEVARALWPDGWRERMPQVREVAADLADAGTVRVTQGTTEVDVRAARGPVRLRRGPGPGNGSASRRR